RLTARDLASFFDQAKRLLPSQPTWSAVTLATPDGRQILHTSRPLGDPLMAVTDHASFDRALAGRPAIGDLRSGRISRELGFPVRVPVIRDDAVVYVLSAWI